MSSQNKIPDTLVAIRVMWQVVVHIHSVSRGQGIRKKIKNSFMQRTAFLAFLGVIVLLLAFTAHETRYSSSFQKKNVDIAKAVPLPAKTLAR